jgi:hypothetical protein
LRNVALRSGDDANERETNEGRRAATKASVA